MTYVALLRGINVGGNKMVAMADLRSILTTMGLTDVVTVLQSGNVVFRTGKTAPSALETRLEAGLQKRMKLSVDFQVRSADGWKVANT